MTPAEKLAKRKQRSRPPRNSTKDDGPLVCKCRELRESLGLTLADVAAFVGISTAGLHAVEHGNDCQMSTAIKLATFYGRPVGELWRIR